jgi:tRNA threonylcarbamoyladenosine biosynthesis protein TsaE
MQSFQIESGSPEETRRAGRALGVLLEAGDVLALSGELGAGKTELVRGLAEALGIPVDEVRSPTFTLVNRYEGSRMELVHVDAYRLTGAGALVDLGYEEVLDPEAAVAIEWSPRVEAALPEDRLSIAMAHVAEGVRALHARAGGVRSGELLARWIAALEGGAGSPEAAAQRADAAREAEGCD